MDTTVEASSIAGPTHDKNVAADFLAILDPTTSRFTFQFFGDGDDDYAKVVHGSLDDVWPRVQALNTPARRIGVFVTINETDFEGREAKNVVRPRALFVDADGPDQMQRCRDAIRASGAEPTMVVRSSPGRAHFYFCCDDLPRDQFSVLQGALMDKLKTDRVKDLPRVMRLPGTLNLKYSNCTHRVTLRKVSQERRWKVRDLTTALGLSATSTAGLQITGKSRYSWSKAFPPADVERLQRLLGPPKNEPGAGLETNLEEIRSAVSAIPPSAISSEPDWMNFMRGMAHEARIKGQAEQLWDIADTASRSAPGYDASDNRNRWLRYMAEALDRDNPITIGTVFGLAQRHGWQGWSPPTAASTSSGGFGPSTSLTAGLNVSFSNIPHRRWLYGVDLIRGEITLLAAPGGVGKSSLAIGISVSVAAGKALIGEKIWDNDLTTLYLNGEDSGTEMQRRICAFCLKHDVAEQDLARLHVAGADDWRVQKVSLLRTEKANSLLDENGIAHLEALLEALRPDLIVLDPLVVFCGGGNINDNAAMSLVMRALKQLATKFDCAVLVIHHTRKGGDLSNAEAISGASAIVNLARRAIMTVAMTAEEMDPLGVLPSQRSRYFKVVAAKSNLAPRSDDAPWYELSSVDLPNPEPPTYPFGDRVQAVTRVTLPLHATPASNDQQIRRAILDVVDRGKVIDGQSYPYSPNTTGAKNQRALIDDAMAAVATATAPRQWHPGDLQSVVRRSIERMKADGWLLEDQIKSGRFRGRRSLRVDWSRTPWANTGAATTSSCSTAVDAEDVQHGRDGGGGQLVNGVVND